MLPLSPLDRAEWEREHPSQPRHHRDLTWFDITVLLCIGAFGGTLLAVFG